MQRETEIYEGEWNVESENKHRRNKMLRNKKWENVKKDKKNIK